MMQPTRQHWDDDAVTPPATTEVARLELAALRRLLARERLTPIGGARVAARDPENQSSYLIHPAAPLFEEAKPSGMVTVDRDGVHQDTREREPDAGTLAIVLAALEARSDAAAAALIASTAGCVVASLEVGLLPITQTAFMFHGAIGTLDVDPEADSDAIRRGVADALGDGRALLVARGRGLFVCGETRRRPGNCCSSWISAADPRSRRWRLRTPLGHR